MADFFRPEAKAAVWRLRDVIAAGLVVALGLWWALTGFGFLLWLGLAVMGLGFVLLFAGIQRARFRRGSGGPGIIQITERRLAYFGPLDGGVMDVEQIVSLSFDPAGHPAPQWILRGPEARDLAIPTTAQGAEQLFDVFSALPGIKTDALLTTLSHPPARRVTLWHRPNHLLH